MAASPCAASPRSTPHLIGEGLAGLAQGARIELVPSHGDTTLNLHDVYNVRRGDEVVEQWPILGARKFR